MIEFVKKKIEYFTMSKKVYHIHMKHIVFCNLHESHRFEGSKELISSSEKRVQLGNYNIRNLLF